jgi:hypothetical protein
MTMNEPKLIRTVTDLLDHEMSREVYETSTTKFHVFGDLNYGAVVYEINVALGRKKGARTDSYCVRWSARRGWGPKTGWKQWQRWERDESTALAFAREKLETLRKWADEQKAEAA